MATNPRLEPPEREFFQLIANAAFCNPFSETRAELDSQIVGHPVAPFSEAHLDELTSVVRARLKKLEERGLMDLRRFPAAEQELMQTAFLFELFHEYLKEFDQLILAQVKMGAQSVRV